MNYLLEDVAMNDLAILALTAAFSLLSWLLLMLSDWLLGDKL